MHARFLFGVICDDSKPISIAEWLPLSSSRDNIVDSYFKFLACNSEFAGASRCHKFAKLSYITANEGLGGGGSIE